jgi:transcriptional regulator with XRE-family HTH domain
MDKLAAALRDRQGDQSLRGLARDLGVATGTAEAWLKGWRQPGYGHLPTISDYLEVPIDEIIGWIIDEEPREKFRFSGIGLPTQPVPQLAYAA